MSSLTGFFNDYGLSYLISYLQTYNYLELIFAMDAVVWFINCYFYISLLFWSSKTFPSLLGCGELTQQIRILRRQTAELTLERNSLQIKFEREKDEWESTNKKLRTELVSSYFKSELLVILPKSVVIIILRTLLFC